MTVLSTLGSLVCLGDGGRCATSVDSGQDNYGFGKTRYYWLVLLFIVASLCVYEVCVCCKSKLHRWRAGGNVFRTCSFGPQTNCDVCTSAGGRTAAGPLSVML